MNLLASTVALMDITDVEGFVNSTINRASLSLTHDERDELVAEGLAILYRLASIYKPNPTHARQESRFSGFAAQFLPRKLGDAWHRMHPEHRLVTDPETGKRRWVYLDKTTSFDRVVTTNGSEELGRVNESDVRHLNQFVPVAVPTRPRPNDAHPADQQSPRAA